MTSGYPHFLLFSEAGRSGGDRRWRFVLESLCGSSHLEATGDEPEFAANRLELLAVVRGLEALDQPSRVSLVTSSRYVSRGMRFGLEQWRENDWKWERFGEMVTINHVDLWQRVNHALRYHRVDCRTWAFATADAETELVRTAVRPRAGVRARTGSRRGTQPAASALGSRMAEMLVACRQWVGAGRTTARAC